MERPKVFYNERTKKFVMYAHLDGHGGYKFASVGVLTCDRPDGDYQYVKSFRPLGKESRDIGQFVDDDGSAYLIFECRPTKGFYIAKLSDDFMDVEKEVCLLQAPLEGGAVVHYKGLYYVIGSALTGWRPNPNKYATAPALERPWSEFKDIAPPGTDTYGSQSTLMLKVTGAKTTSVIFKGDLWRPAALWRIPPADWPKLRLRILPYSDGLRGRLPEAAEVLADQAKAAGTLDQVRATAVEQVELRVSPLP